MIIFAVLSFIGISRPAQAKFINWGTTSITFGWDKDLGEEYVSLPISSKSVMVEVNITNVHITLDDKPVDVNMLVRVGDLYEDEEIYAVRSGESLKFTSWFGEERDTIDFELEDTETDEGDTDFCDISFDITITKLYNAELEVSCKKSVTIKDDGSIMVYLAANYGNDYDIDGLYSIKATSSNENIASVIVDDYDECSIEIYGEGKAGKCKINVVARYKGETCKLSIDVTVKSNLKSTLTAYGGLDYYDTRDNYFTMNITNRSKKPITIYSSGAYALDCDYKSFDRNVKLSGGKSKVVIKPGASKTIKWKVIGSVTWYNVKDFEIHCKWKYKGKTQWVSVEYEYIKVFKSGKWKRIDKV